MDLPAPSATAPVVLLGPQRLRPTLASAVRALAVEGPIAAVTAGWQEREAEVDEMRDHLGRRVVNLMLHERSDDVFARDAELAAAYRERQDLLKQLQDLYRVRLNAAIVAVRQLFEHRGAPEIVEPERAAAVAAIRSLDAHHLSRIVEIHDDFDRRWPTARRPALQRHRRQIARLLAGSGAVAVAGGHVAVLLNRMRLFDLAPLLATRPVFAWSAGAMALGEMVVLFHDSPPQGLGHVEVFEQGLGLYRGVLPFPHARKRLRLDDEARLGRIARRFAHLVCVALDEGARLRLDPHAARPTAEPGTLRLTVEGRLAEVGAA